MPSLDLNSKDIRRYVKDLEKLQKHKLPKVVQRSLNRTATIAKKNTLIKVTNQTFTNRQKNFFKANSRITFAKFDQNISNIKSEFGMISRARKSNAQDAVYNMLQQEVGGVIDDREFIAADDARVGRSNAKMVGKANRLSNGQKIYRASKNRARRKKERYIRTAIHVKKGGLVLSEPNAKGNQTVNRITKVKNSKGKTVVKSKVLYSFSNGRKVKAKGRRFLKRTTDLRVKMMKADFMYYAQKSLKLR